MLRHIGATERKKEEAIREETRKIPLGSVDVD
jgi:hypothetical protein